MGKKQITNPVKAIRKYCLSCMEGSYRDVELCEETECALHPFRMGKNPFRTKREMTEEQKKAAAERLRKAREARSSKNS